jgi:hypothetical protein
MSAQREAACGGALHYRLGKVRAADRMMTVAVARRLLHTHLFKASRGEPLIADGVDHVPLRRVGAAGPVFRAERLRASDCALGPARKGGMRALRARGQARRIAVNIARLLALLQHGE